MSTQTKSAIAPCSTKTIMCVPFSHHTLMSLKEVANTYFGHIHPGFEQIQTVAETLLDITEAFITDEDNGFTYRMGNQIWKFRIEQYEEESFPLPSNARAKLLLPPVGSLSLAVPDSILMTNYLKKDSNILTLTDAEVANYALRWALLTVIAFNRNHVYFRLHLKKSRDGAKPVEEPLYTIFRSD